jgi:hypothetical protein
MDPIWSQSDIDALKVAITRGVLSVTFGNRTTTYHSLKEMRLLLAEMVGSVSQQTTGPTGYRLGSISKGV